MKYPSAKLMFFLLITLTPIIVLAEEQMEETPSLDFLEFLGEWSTQKNEWIDPSLLEKFENGDNDASTEKDGQHE